MTDKNITKAWLRGGAGVMRDRRMRRQKTRASQKQRALRESRAWFTHITGEK